MQDQDLPGCDGGSDEGRGKRAECPSTHRSSDQSLAPLRADGTRWEGRQGFTTTLHYSTEKRAGRSVVLLQAALHRVAPGEEGERGDSHPASRRTMSLSVFVSCEQMDSQAGNGQSCMAVLKTIAAQESSKVKKHRMTIYTPNLERTELPPVNKLLKTTLLHFRHPPTLSPLQHPEQFGRCQGTWPCLWSLDHCPVIISLAPSWKKIP